MGYNNSTVARCSMVNSWYAKLLLALTFATLTALAAQIRIPLPFTPVPITMQTAIVLSAGLVLGPIWAFASMAIYIVAGALGAPVFSGGASGVAALTGPTAGYLLGFIVASLLTGFFRGSTLRTATGTILGMLAIYIFGIGYLIVGMNMTVPAALSAGLYPFIVGAILKLVLVNSGDFAVRRIFRRDHKDKKE